MRLGNSKTLFSYKQKSMPHFSHIIFDLDGTLTDNTEGIKNSLMYSLEQLHITNYSEEILDQFIGPPLQWGFKTLFGLNEQNTKLAVDYFRTYYGENGWHQNTPYDGIMEMLAELEYQGKKMFIATSKLEKYALKIIQHFEIDKYIIQLKGIDYGGKSTKSELIVGLMTRHQIVPSGEVVMVGDTLFDIEGGKENEISTIAVNYGFGVEEKLKSAHPDFFVEDVEELFELLSS